MTLSICTRIYCNAHVIYSNRSNSVLSSSGYDTYESNTERAAHGPATWYELLLHDAWCMPCSLSSRCSPCCLERAVCCVLSSCGGETKENTIIHADDGGIYRRKLQKENTGAPMYISLCEVRWRCCTATWCSARVRLKSGGSVRWNRSASQKIIRDGTYTRTYRSSVRTCHKKETLKYVGSGRGTNDVTTPTYCFNRITIRATIMYVRTL